MQTTIDLADGTTLPRVGLGTYGLRGATGAEQMAAAIRAGYRLLDSAAGYRNEEATGRAVRESGVPRAEVAVTTKLAGQDHGHDSTLRAFGRSVAALGLEVVDLYLIHWPEPQRDRYVDSWRAMIELQREGRIRSIGVSNFSVEQIERLERETGVLPAVNQVELHLGADDPALRAFHDAHGIATESYSPLTAARGDVVTRIADAHGVSAPQVALRWNLQLGCIAIPKSKDPARQAANLDLFGFELSDDEMRELSEVGA